MDLAPSTCHKSLLEIGQNSFHRGEKNKNTCYNELLNVTKPVHIIPVISVVALGIYTLVSIVL